VRRNRLFWADPHAPSHGGRRSRSQRAFNWKASIWAPRAVWADSKSLWDTERVARLRFRREWPMALELGLARDISRYGKLPSALVGEAAVRAAVEAVAVELERDFLFWHRARKRGTPEPTDARGRERACMCVF
jgi:hypothetical protein